MTAPSYVTNTPSNPAIHNEPPSNYTWQQLSQTQLDGLRTELVGGLVRLITELPQIAANLIRQMIAMIGEAEELIEEIISAVLSWISQAPALVTTVIQTVLQWITDLPDLATVVINAILGIITDIPDLIQTVINSFMEWITNTPDLIISVIDGVLQWITGSEDLIQQVITTALSWVQNLPTMATAIIEAFLDMVKTLPTMATAILDAITTWATEIPEFVTELINALLSWITDVPDLLINVVTTFINWITDDTSGLAVTIIHAMLDWITVIPELITTVITTVMNWITSIPEIAADVINALLQVVTDIPDLASAVINAVVSWVTAIPELASALINGVVQWLTLAPELLDTLITGILDLITELPTLILNVIDTALGWITDDTSGGLATSLINSVMQWITDFPDLLDTVVSSLLDLVSAAPVLIESVINAFVGWVASAPELITTVINSIVDWIEAVPELAGTILNTVVTLITRAPEIAQAVVSAIITVIAAAPTLILDVITAVLAWLDDITGLNLASWAGMLGGFFGTGSGFSGILGAFTNAILGFGSNVHSTIPILGSGQMSGVAQNLLIDGLFGSTNAFEQAGGWLVDMGTSITGAIGSAVASVVTGFQSLLGNVLHILPGDTVSVSAQTRWDGLDTSASAGGGTGLLSAAPLSANVNFYDASNNLLMSTPLAAAGGTAGAPATPSSIGGFGLSGGVFSLSHETRQWSETSDNHIARTEARRGALRFGLDPDDDWVPLEGSYVVPDTIGGVVPVTATIMLQISDEVDGGQVWFTKSSLDKMNLIRQELVHNLPEDKQAIIDNASGLEGGSVTDIANRFVGINPITGEMSWTYVPDVRSVNDALVTNLNGWVGADFEHADAATALLSTKAALTSANSQINTLKTQVAGMRADIAAIGAPARSKVFWQDTFERVGTTLGTGWVQTYFGSGSTMIGTNGHQAAPGTLSLADRYMLAQWAAASVIQSSATDYQLATKVLSTAPTWEGGAGGYGDVLGRMSADRNNCVRFRIIRTGTFTGAWYLDYVSSGVAHNIATGVVDGWPTTMELQCGDISNTAPTYLAITSDNTTLWEGLETNHNIGSSYRGMGWGYGIDYGSGSTPGIGGLVDTWTGIDQVLG